jgi:hypothetical protein
MASASAFIIGAGFFAFDSDLWLFAVANGEVSARAAIRRKVGFMARL